MSDIRSLSRIYEALSVEQEIYVVPIRMKEEKLRIPSDDEDHAIMIADYFLQDSPLMLFAPRLVMEAWFFAGRVQPRKDLPIEVHVPGELISEDGAIPIKRMKFINEQEYAASVSEIQKGRVSKYRAK